MPDTQVLANQLFQQGQQCRINGEYEQAIALLQRAISFDDACACAHMELGLAYCYQGSFDESIQALQRAVDLNPSSAEAHLHLAKTYTMLGMYDEGILEFRMVMVLTSPDDKSYAEAEKQLSYFPEEMFSDQ